MLLQVLGTTMSKLDRVWLLLSSWFRMQQKDNTLKYTGGFFFFCLFAFSRATFKAHGGSQARGLIGGVAAGLCQIRAVSATCTTAHGHAGSLTHGVRPGIEPAFSWMPIRFISADPQQELQIF